MAARERVLELEVYVAEAEELDSDKTEEAFFELVGAAHNKYALQQMQAEKEAK